jgi:hypothetical protein
MMGEGFSASAIARMMIDWIIYNADVVSQGAPGDQSLPPKTARSLGMRTTLDVFHVSIL